VLLLDVIEHLHKADALALIGKAERLARLAVAIETPKGFLPQNLDILGLGGDHVQTHRSGWDADELASLGYAVIERPYRLSGAKRHTTETSPDSIVQLDAIKRLAA